MWIVICIPSSDGESGDWFAYNRRTRKFVACRSAKHAADTCAKMRQREKKKTRKPKG